jgi:hypothetical protein
MAIHIAPCCRPDPVIPLTDREASAMMDAVHEKLKGWVMPDMEIEMPEPTDEDIVEALRLSGYPTHESEIQEVRDALLEFNGSYGPIAAHAETIAKLRVSRAWRDIATAPKDGSDFLALWWAADGKNDARICITGWWEEAPGGPRFANEQDTIGFCQPTHWVPFPPALTENGDR